jgi:opacity protein-like surface antigen
MKKMLLAGAALAALAASAHAATASEPMLAPAYASEPDAMWHAHYVEVGKMLEHNAIRHSGPTSLAAREATIQLDPNEYDFLNLHRALAHQWTMEGVNEAAKHPSGCAMTDRQAAKPKQTNEYGEPCAPGSVMNRFGTCVDTNPH